MDQDPRSKEQVVADMTLLQLMLLQVSDVVACLWVRAEICVVECIALRRQHQSIIEEMNGNTAQTRSLMVSLPVDDRPWKQEHVLVT